jgi:hypothetical protein
MRHVSDVHCCGYFKSYQLQKVSEIKLSSTVESLKIQTLCLTLAHKAIKVGKCLLYRFQNYVSVCVIISFWNHLMKFGSMIWGAVVMEMFVTWFLWCSESKLCNADRCHVLYKLKKNWNNTTTRIPRLLVGCSTYHFLYVCLFKTFIG